MIDRLARAALLEAPHAVFDALADPTRLELIERLVNDSPVSITELAAGFPISRQAVSKHMVVLAEAGLLKFEKLGRERRVLLSPEPLDDAARWIARIESKWDARLAALKLFLGESGSSD